jgi:hypothetical protein
MPLPPKNAWGPIGEFVFFFFLSFRIFNLFLWVHNDTSVCWEDVGPENPEEWGRHHHRSREKESLGR